MKVLVLGNTPQSLRLLFLFWVRPTHQLGRLFWYGSSTNKVISFNVSNIALVFTKVSPFFSKYLSYSSMIERKLLVLFKEHAVVVGVAFLHITHDFHRLFLALTLALAVFEWPE